MAILHLFFLSEGENAVNIFSRMVIQLRTAETVVSTGSLTKSKRPSIGLEADEITSYRSAGKTTMTIFWDAKGPVFAVC